MAKKAKKLHTKKGVELKIVNPNAAGIDIADTEMQVCVPVDRDGDNNRRFGSFTQDLNEICGWLRDCGIDTAAMEYVIRSMTTQPHGQKCGVFLTQ